MPRLKLLPDAAVTLPDEIRPALHLSLGDEFDAEVTGDALVLREATREEEPASTLKELLAKRRAIRLDPEPTGDEAMADALGAVAEVRPRLGGGVGGRRR